MRLAPKAAIYSGLICPGLGQWMLGQKARAAAYASSAVFLVGLLGVRIYIIVYNGILPGGDLTRMDLSVANIERIHSRAYAENWWVLLLFVAVWLASVIDAYLAGKKAEKELEVKARPLAP